MGDEEWYRAWRARELKARQRPKPWLGLLAAAILGLMLIGQLAESW